MTGRISGFRSVAVPLSALFLAACTPRLGPPSAAATEDVILVVENGHFDAVWVGVERGGVRIPLGRVDGVSQRRFRLGATSFGAASRVTLVAGVRSRQSAAVEAPLELEPGMHVRWVLTQGLNYAALIR